MEQINLAAPASVPATTRWIVQDVRLIVGTRYDNAGLVIVEPLLSEIYVHLVGDQQQVREHRWQGAAAHADIVALNKVNLSVKSLHKRIMEKLIADAVVEGTITGTPD